MYSITKIDKTMSNETKTAIETTVFQHDLENVLDEVIDMLPEDEKHTALLHIVASYNAKFGTCLHLVPLDKLSFAIDRIDFCVKDLKKLKP